MIRRQAALLLACLLPLGAAGEVPEFVFEPPVVKVSRFGEEVKMMPKERDEYATNLAIHAANLVREEEADPVSLLTAKRLLATALHLSPRNRQALVTGFQLKKGILPEARQPDYTAPVLSRLLLSRARLLLRDDEEEGRVLARHFIELAATIDPRNEDAVFEFEVQRLDHGDLDWEPLFESRPDAAPTGD